MSQLVPFNPQSAMPAAIANALAQSPLNDNPLSEGVGVSCANVSIKGKVFRIKYAGQETLLVDPSNNTPMQYFDVIIVDAKAELSKTFYQGGYTEGSSDQPDCASEDGITPFAPPGKQVQSHDCRLCPWNVYGSKKSTDGTATNSKACADTRKLVVVPPSNIDNERFGGPMLLRVPAASLGPLAEFDRSLRSNRVPFYAVVVRITFDYNVAYPRLVFTALNYIDEQQAAKILALREDGRVKDILHMGAPAPAAPTPTLGLQGQPPAAMQQQPVQQQQQPVQQQQQPVQQQQQPVQQQQQPVQQQVSFVPPPVQQQHVAQQAPTLQQQQPPQQSAGQQFAPPPVQQQPVQQQQQYAPPPPVQQQQPVQQHQYAPPPPVQQQVQQQQPQQFAPPPVQQQPFNPSVGSNSPVPEGVLNAVDNLLGG